MQHFLLIYDHKRQELRAQRAFGDRQRDEATQAYQNAEQECQNDPNVEIVLIGADSIETIMRTHGHYFADTDPLAKYLSTTG